MSRLFEVDVKMQLVDVCEEDQVLYMPADDSRLRSGASSGWFDSIVRNDFVPLVVLTVAVLACRALRLRILRKLQ